MNNNIGLLIDTASQLLEASLTITEQAGDIGQWEQKIVMKVLRGEMSKQAALNLINARVQPDEACSTLSLKRIEFLSGDLAVKFIAEGKTLYRFAAGEMKVVNIACVSDMVDCKIPLYTKA